VKSGPTLLSGCEAAPHDFAVTKSWYVMIQNCLKVDPLPYLAGMRGAGVGLYKFNSVHP
jgi:all-trans-8'-apo-beta-carotenal 15,15'-oxygenase